ncbi:MAG: short-subunit dehydrogenase [Gammaproteobacteria bacterium]|jgi:short-subunit dehydrogenase
MISLRNKKILVTGATGGIGIPLCKLLLQSGASLVVTSGSQDKLDQLVTTHYTHSGQIIALQKNLLLEGSAAALVCKAQEQLHGLDMVINLAGLQTFRALENLSEEDISKQIQLNLSVPIETSKAAIRYFKTQRGGCIVNIGSAFGSIGFAQYSVYCATKFGLRGFSEALRRELQNTGINVVHIAPRATRTGMNSQGVYDMAGATGTHVDNPVVVAQRIVKAIVKQKPNTSIGFQESLFSKINGLFPSLVDKILSKQSSLAGSYANANISVNKSTITRETHA